MPIPPPISTAYLEIQLARSEREGSQASWGHMHCKGGHRWHCQGTQRRQSDRSSVGANGRPYAVHTRRRQMRRREMAGPLSVARAVTDPRIMRNEPSHRPRAEPSARSDVAPRQAGDTASTVPCPRTAQSDPRGAQARGGAFAGPRTAGRSLSDTKRPPQGSCNSHIPREQVFCCICSSSRLCHTSGSVFFSRCLE